MAANAAEQKTHGIAVPMERQGQVFRFVTAGSVDDGKSTLIGRLLYDSQSIYEDQLLSIQKSRINRAEGPFDFSLLTDGLRAEREQGITIDVAYRYFSTASRKFIIADTPGHEQYTRNMVTGASTADAAVILVDARKGLLTQSRRHAYIASLLGIEHVIAAVNKMDLVEYGEEVFARIASDFREMAALLGIPHTYAIPVSALRGDGIVSHGNNMLWFDGPPLLEYLETLPSRTEDIGLPLRLPIQCVIRPDSQFRGFAGQIVSGLLRRGAKVVSLPSRIQTRVKSIVTWDGELESARAGQSITVTLEDEIDLGRGDLLVEEDELPQIANQFVAHLVWLHSDPSRPEQDYLLKHTTRLVRVRMWRIHYGVDVTTLQHLAVSTLRMNDIAVVEMEAAQPLFFDAYRQNRSTGSFILIDPITNATVAAGMIEASGRQHSPHAPPPAGFPDSGFSPADGRMHTENLSAAWITARPSLAGELESATLQGRWPVQWISGLEFNAAELKAIAKVLRRMRVLAVFFIPGEDTELPREITSIFGADSVMIEEPSASNSELFTTMMDWLRGLTERAKKKHS
jgi:sulfate adenylyltransferase large subunit